MKIQNVQEAATLAARFIELAKLSMAESDEKYYSIQASKISGALRRCSMDLTRALAEMRKP
jgi:hypothetical protein